MTDDSSLFISKEIADSPDLVPLLEGKQYWILTEPHNKPTYLMLKKNVEIKRTTKNTRVVYRAVSASTNERTFIPTVIPEGLPTGNTVNVCPLRPFDAMAVAGPSVPM